MGDNLQISKLKVKNLQEWAQFLMLEIKRFTSFVCRYYVFLCKKSLAHAKMLEDVAENFVGCDLTAGDFGKDIEDLAEVFSKEVATKVDVHAFYNAQETFVGAKEGVVVAD